MAAELPNMNELLKNFLQSRTAAHAGGLMPQLAGEVELHDAVPAQSLDPKQAWVEATAVFAHFKTAIDCDIPADWTQLILGPEVAIALPFAAGHFPQSVRDLQRLARSLPPAELPREATGAMPLVGIQQWADRQAKKGSVADVLLAAGVLRAARHFDRAAEVLQRVEKSVADPYRAAWGNEQAALDWARGDRAAAAKLWGSLPDSAPVQFNRGLAALFSRNKSAASDALAKAVARIDETSGWHHLGRIYLALARS
jgi:hypothetical protein